jgi:hypothetical protein
MTALNAAILFNNSTGSDTTASGSSAGANVYGSGASTTSASAVVTGITTTGVQAGDLLWVQSSNGRQFSVIASVDSGTQVTCDDTFANTESSRTWAIGGKRATLNGSRRIFDDGSSGDGKAGHILELEDGHTESISSSLNLRVAGSTTEMFTIRGASGSTTKPKITVTANTSCFNLIASYNRIENIEIQNTFGNKTFANGFYANFTSPRSIQIVGVKMDDATNYLQFGVYLSGSASGDIHISNCSIGNCGNTGIYLRSCSGNQTVSGSQIFNCTGNGILQIINASSCLVSNSVLYGNSNGVAITDGKFHSQGSIYYNNTNDGFSYSGNDPFTLTNNVFVSNGAYGVDAGSSPSESMFFIDRNAFYGNGTADFNGSLSQHTNSITLTADPFVDSAAADFNIADNTAGNTLRANNFSLNTDTAVYPFRQYVSDAFGAGGGGAGTYHPLYLN